MRVVPFAFRFRTWDKSQLFLWLCAPTIFLSAFLLFLIEPMIAKMILPSFGGSAAVWATCLIFFQSTLLLGYSYADIVSRRLSRSQQILLHTILLAVSLFFLPILPGLHGRSTGIALDPVRSILLLLMGVIGLPFALLSATTPLLQTWWKQVTRQTDPYHLFSLSNFASFLALLSYPFLIEPQISIRAQGQGWSALFAVFVLLCGSTALLSRTGFASTIEINQEVRDSPSWLRRLHWLALSACGSLLLLTVTNHLTQNVAPVPLLWVLPLALYLLSFTLVFSRTPFYPRQFFLQLLAVALGAMGYTISEGHGIRAMQVSVPFFCVGLFVCCMFCHGELNRLRPTGTALTSFYLTLSLGGVFGAVFVGLVAPRLFSGLYDFPLALFLTGLLATVTLWSCHWRVRLFWILGSLVLSYILITRIASLKQQSILMTRNFYGALRVTTGKEGTPGQIKKLYHGAILHGAQYQTLPWRKVPLTYYSFHSGIGLALQFCCTGPKRVGVIGLGVGTLAAYGRTGDFFHFYEINPAVVQIAHSSFTYLQECPARQEITLGDARLSLQSEPSQQFDVLAVDAFSGDAIPTHLLTEEAIELYLQHLKPNGILAVHTSNSFLVLDAVAKQLADRLGYPAKLVTNDDNESLSIAHSDWVLISRNSRFLTSPVVVKSEESITIPGNLQPWTDNHNNLFQILRP